MRLVNTQTDQSLVEFQGDQTLFHNIYLEKEMRSIGIPIPHGLRGVYHGKDTILLGDEEFQKAFKEVYYLTTMDTEIFQWIE